MNKKSLINAKQLIEKEHTTIISFLQKLQDVEFDIISVDPDIASGNVGCFHIRPCSFFNDYHDYKPYTKSKIEYKIESYEDDGIKVKFNYKIVLVPYEFSEVKFNQLCDSLFADTRKAMERCQKQKVKFLGEVKKEKENNKRIREQHTFGDYTYHWTNCTNCSSGHVQVGTGKYEDDPWSESYRQREITVTRYCPVCEGTMGLLCYINSDIVEYIQKPCSVWTFERHEKDFVKLLAMVL